jgi:hypothetical protein
MSDAAPVGGLSALGALPPPAPLAAGQPRHSPDRRQLREAIRHLGDRWSWSELSWSELVEALLVVGRTDLPLGRLTEGHADALRICDQAGHRAEPGALYGVWASRSGATGVQARPAAGGLALTGELRFASGAGMLDRALVPVRTSDDTHVLVDLSVADLEVDRTLWHTRAMADSHSHLVRLHAVSVPDEAVVGVPNFYLDRPAFLPGGVGVAAVWVGGMARVCDLVLAWLGERGTPATDLRLGRVRTALAVSAAVVRQAGQQLDGLLGPHGRSRDGVDRARVAPLCTEARAAVGAAVDEVLTHVRAVAGPAGLAFDAELTRAVDDLTLYALQQNRDADAAYLGRAWR